MLPDALRLRHLLAKWPIELAVCLVLVPLVLLIFLLCALAITLDSPGPILTRQERTGRNGRRFGMLRFRTVVHNGDQLKGALAHLNVFPPPDFKIPDDPRVTRVGTFLRQTSLDELPRSSTSFGARCPSWTGGRGRLRPSIEHVARPLHPLR